MPKSRGWGTWIVLGLGILAASLYWLYGSNLKREVTRQVTEVLEDRAQPSEAVPKGAEPIKRLPSQALGTRYQLVSDGKQTFLADLKEGRVWRYFHHTRESGYLREDEGFLPLPFFYGGKKLYSAGEVDASAPKPLGPSGESNP